jgi:hypothetical protein
MNNWWGNGIGVKVHIVLDRYSDIITNSIKSSLFY